MEAERHAPVSLPSGGSYDAETLQKGLDKAVDKRGSNRDAEVRKAIDSARTDAPMTAAASSTMPGHTLMKSETQLVAGAETGTGKAKEVVGGVTVTELRQVQDPDASDSSPKGDAVVPAGGQAVIGERSEVLSLDAIDGGKPPEEPPAPVTVPPKDAETGEPGTTTDVDTAVAGAAAAAEAGEE